MSTKAAVKHAREALAAKDYSSALQHLDHVLAEPKPPVAALVYAGTARLRLGEASLALALFRRATDADPKAAAAWRGAADAAHEAGDPTAEAYSLAGLLSVLDSLDKTEENAQRIRETEARAVSLVDSSARAAIAVASASLPERVLREVYQRALTVIAASVDNDGHTAAVDAERENSQQDVVVVGGDDSSTGRNAAGLAARARLFSESAPVSSQVSFLQGIARSARAPATLGKAPSMIIEVEMSRAMTSRTSSANALSTVKAFRDQAPVADVARAALVLFDESGEAPAVREFTADIGDITSPHASCVLCSMAQCLQSYSFPGQSAVYAAATREWVARLESVSRDARKVALAAPCALLWSRAASWAAALGNASVARHFAQIAGSVVDFICLVKRVDSVPALSAAVDVARGDAALCADERRVALRHFQNALRLNPECATAACGLGEVLLRAGRSVEAAAAFARGLARQGSDAAPTLAARAALAKYDSHAGAEEDAVCMLKATAFDSFDGRCLAALAEVHVAAGAWRDAERAAVAAAKLDNSCARAFAALSKALEARGAEQASLRALERAVLLDPSLAMSARALYDAYMARGQRVAAEETAARHVAAARAAAAPWAYEAAARVAARKGDTGAVAAALQHAASAAPNDARLRAALADALAAGGQLRTALLAARAAVALRVGSSADLASLAALGGAAKAADARSQDSVTTNESADTIPITATAAFIALMHAPSALPEEDAVLRDALRVCALLRACGVAESAAEWAEVAAASAPTSAAALFAAGDARAALAVEAQSGGFLQRAKRWAITAGDALCRCCSVLGLDVARMSENEPLAEPVADEEGSGITGVSAIVACLKRLGDIELLLADLGCGSSRARRAAWCYGEAAARAADTQVRASFWHDQGAALLRCCTEHGDAAAGEARQCFERAAVALPTMLRAWAGLAAACAVCGNGAEARAFALTARAVSLARQQRREGTESAGEDAALLAGIAALLLVEAGSELEAADVALAAIAEAPSSSVAWLARALAAPTAESLPSERFDALQCALQSGRASPAARIALAAAVVRAARGTGSGDQLAHGSAGLSAAQSLVDTAQRSLRLAAEHAAAAAAYHPAAQYLASVLLELAGVIHVALRTYRKAMVVAREEHYADLEVSAAEGFVRCSVAIDEKGKEEHCDPHELDEAREVLATSAAAKSVGGVHGCARALARARDALATGDTRGAATALNIALPLVAEGDDPFGAVSAARVLVALNRHGEASALLRVACESGDAAAGAAAARVAAMSGSVALATELAPRLSTPAQGLVMGGAHLANGDAASATAALGEALFVDHDDAVSRSLCYALLYRASPAAVFACFHDDPFASRVLKAEPALPLRSAALGSLLQYGCAVSMRERAIEANAAEDGDGGESIPGAPEAAVSEVVIEYVREKRDAVAEAMRLARASPDNAQVWLQVASALSASAYAQLRDPQKWTGAAVRSAAGRFDAAVRALWPRVSAARAREAFGSLYAPALITVAEATVCGAACEDGIPIDERNARIASANDLLSRAEAIIHEDAACGTSTSALESLVARTRARTAWMQSRTGEALADMHRAVCLNSNALWLWQEYALMLSRDGRHRAAERTAAHAASTARARYEQSGADVDATELHACLLTEASVATARGDDGVALRSLGEALDLPVQYSPHAVLLQGVLQQRRGKANRTAACIAHALELDADAALPFSLAKAMS